MPSYLFIIYYCLYLFAPAAPCSYSLPVSAAPAVPFVIPLLLAFSLASSGFTPVLPGSVIFSVISLFTAVGSCSFSFAGVIGSFSLYSFNGSSFLPISVLLSNNVNLYLYIIHYQLYNIQNRQQLSLKTASIHNYSELSEVEKKILAA